MKRLLFLILLPAIYFLLPAPAYAQEEFNISVASNYDIGDSGTTTVSHTVTLTNRFSQIHAVSYSFQIEGAKPTNVRAFEQQTQLPIQLSTAQNATIITVSFPRAVVGKDKSRVFNILYDDDRVAIKNGQVWEITIPKLDNPDHYQNYALTISVPSSFGQPAYISPKPEQTSQGTHIIFTYNGKQIAQAGVVAAFGSFQVFHFELDYHLKNQTNRRGTIEIALPPDTSFQRVYYQNIAEKPLSIRLDGDGNWLALYQLGPGEQRDVKAQGVVQVFASPQTFYPRQIIPPGSYLAPSPYWQTDDPQIKILAKQLGTARAIYDYVVKKLSYDYNRVQEGVERLGAKKALESPDQAICMEFTDLFVALARSAGIPAREVNGFAYTENPKLQPLSLVADVLHAWPEYWDSAVEVWRPIDPTWGNTTGGVDYFSKFDLSHITFAIHGQDASYPLPAGSYKVAENPQKDVVMFFGELPQKRMPTLEVTFKVNRRLMPFMPLTGTLQIQNKGPVALYDVQPMLTSSKDTITVQNPQILFIAPFTTAQVPFIINNNSFLLAGRSLPQLTAIIGNLSYSYQIPPDLVLWEVVGSFLALLFVTIALLGVILMRKKIVRLFWHIWKRDTGPDDSNQPPPSTGKTRRLPFQR